MSRGSSRAASFAESAASSVEKLGQASAGASDTDLEDTRTEDALAPPVLPELHAAAQAGDVQKVHDLLDAGQASASDEDAQGIVGTSRSRKRRMLELNMPLQQTALHWAAINNRLLVCKELLLRGADVDAIGGELQATPLQWAARNGHIAICHLLITHGADPALVDAQGFNTLHLAVHSSSPMLLLYILAAQLPLAIDSGDAAGRSALMWAAYQGDGISVEILLKFGASPNKQDPTGLSSLHWAVVKGNVTCIAKIVEAGVDLGLRTSDTNMTGYELSKQLNSTPAYLRALKQLGLDPQTGRHKRSAATLNDKNTRVALWLLPGAVLGAMFKTCDLLPWYTALPLVGAEFYGLHHVVTKVLLDSMKGDPFTKVQRSPYLAGLLAGSIFWVGYAWLSDLLRETSGMPLTNAALFLFLTLCAYNFWRAVTLDPGFIPISQSKEQLKEVVEGLVAQGQLTGANFCLVCMIRKPLRSKHCRLCDRCTARHDHHCPWIFNDVGVQNHRQFFLFITNLILGIGSFDRLAIAYFVQKTPRGDQVPDTLLNDTVCLFPQPICLASSMNTFLFTVVLWASLQLTWTLLVLGGQCWQIARQLTTLELSNLGRYGYMGGKGGQSLAAQESHPANRLNQSQRQIETHECSRHGDHPHHHHHHCRPSNLLKKILPGGLLTVLGLDLYTKGKGTEGFQKSATDQGKNQNPFDLGVWRNCTDFWTRGKTLDVDYMQLYEIPEIGFKQQALNRRRQQNASDRAKGKDREQDSGRQTKRGYEMLRTDDV